MKNTKGFIVDYVEETDTVVLFTSCGSRNLTISVKTESEPGSEVVDGKTIRKVIRHVTSVECDVSMPSIERRRAGFRSPLDEDVQLVRRIDDATNEDVLAAMQWLVEKEA